MRPQRLSDAEERRAALDVTRSFIVQAPAGSGKTGLLTRRFLRLLATVDAPEEILAITFTRKAANEMRARVLQALALAHGGAVPDDDYRRGFYEDGVAVLRRDSGRAWNLLGNPGRLQIMTLDALNARLVSRMPVTARAGRLDIVDTHRQRALYDLAASESMDWLTARDVTGAAAARFLDQLDASGEQFRRQLVGMLARRDQWLPTLIALRGHDLTSVRRASERTLAELIDSVLSALDRRFSNEERAALAGLLQYAADNQRLGPAEVGSLSEGRWPAPTAGALPAWQTVATQLLTKQGALRKRVDKRAGFPPGKPGSAAHDRKREMTECLAELAEREDIGELAAALSEVPVLPLPQYDDAQWSVIDALIEFLPVAAGELTRVMSAQGVLDYPALAAAAIDALGDDERGGVTDLALRLDYRLRHILVDEMQDTSPAQYRLIERLTAGWAPGDGNSLFCVGDPMQSIYRFRGADVSRFLDAWEHGVGGQPLERLVLSTNFRSAAGLIDWVNERFVEVLGRDSDPLTDAVRYSPAEPAPDAESGGEVQWHVGLDDAAPDARAVVELVAALKRRHPGQTIGILGRTRSVLEPILTELSRAGIGCEAIEMDRLTDLPEVIDLVNLTRAMEHADDLIAWLGLLRSPLLGWTLADIDSLMRLRVDAPWRDLPLPEQLRDAACTAHLDEHGRRLLARFLDEMDAAVQAAPVASLRDRVAHVWAALGGPATLPDSSAVDNAWAYLETLSGIERDGQLDSLPGLITALDDVRTSRHAAEPTVFAMTIFKSKGLEFDHVIVPALHAGARHGAAPAILFELRGTAGDTAVLFGALEDRRAGEPDLHHQLLRRRERVRDRNELSRLLYVAATRARNSLHLFARGKRTADGEVAKPAPDTLLGRFGAFAQTVLTRSIPPSAATDDAVEKAPGDPVLLPAHHRRIARPWQSPAMRRPRRDERFALATRSELVEFDWAGEGARHVGTVVHAWLQRLAGQGDPVGALGRLGDIDHASRQMLMQLGVGEAQLGPMLARVTEALEGAVAGEHAAWLIGSDGPEDHAELALTALIDGRVQRLVIDRIVRAPDGTLWIVDYKSSRREGGDLAGFFDNERRRYAGQLARYAEAVSAWYDARGLDPGRLRTGLYLTVYGRLLLVGDAGAGSP